MRTMVFTYGRFNPPTIGHGILFDRIKLEATILNADHVVITSHKMDKRSNPLSPIEKRIMIELTWGVNVEVSTKEKPSFIHFLKDWTGKYDQVVMVCGSDREDEYRELINQYNGTEFSFKIAKVISAGLRDPNANHSVLGVSASKAREFAKNGDYSGFLSCMPHNTNKNFWYRRIRERLDVQSNRNQSKGSNRPPD